MPRKSEESAPRRKPPAASEDAATPKKKTAAKSAGAKTKSASAAVPKPAAKKTSAAKSAPAKSAAKKSAATKSAAKPRKAEEARPKAAGTEKPAAKPRKSAKKGAAGKVSASALTGHIEDPIGDVMDGEGHHLLSSEEELESGTAMMDAYRADTANEAERSLSEMEPAKPRPTPSEAAGEEEEGEELEEEEEPEATTGPRPEAHLERLQKILSQAGLASRRHAEEMIVAGRVVVNGQTITQLGAKADPARDHIRVDGKLIQGAERHRTFVLNKPKGFVTTVSDPEGRPTVMQFFEKSRERLYPVGRLDYQSEGLLLMTNDGELANSLTRAASGVEKTYLVKIAGQPTEEELDQLRSGVSIEREQGGSGRVRTAPASVRQVRPGQNPWYEVILIEGRNREIRKMFQAVGHFVEKIRRVGYGPLVLDVEPGQFRELTQEEINALRLTAEGKLKPRRPRSSAMLPKEAGRSAEERFEGRGGPRKGFGRESGRGPQPGRPQSGRPQSGRPQAGRPQTGRPQAERPFRGRPEHGRPPGEGGERGRFEERRFGGNREGRPFRQREGQSFGKPQFDRPRSERPERAGSRARFERPREERGGPRERFDRPREDRGGPRERLERPREERGGERQRFGGRPERGGFGGRPERGGFGGERPRFNKPRSERPERGERQGFGGEERRPRQEFRPREERGERGPRPNRFGGLRIEREGGEEWQPRDRGERPARPPRREGGERPSGPARGGERRSGPPRGEGGERPQRFGGGRPGGGRPPAGGGRPPAGGGRPPAGGGRPSAGGSRPSGGNRRPGFGGGSRRPPFGGRPGGGPPRRDRG